MESPVEKSRVKRSRVKYRPLIGELDVLDSSAAIVQAAYVLDLAGDLAAKNEDVGSLKTLSTGWLDIAKMLTSEDDESSQLPKDKPYGFRAVQQIVEKAEQEVNLENGDGTNKSSSKLRIHVKYGKL